MQKILIPLDFSDCSLHALDMAVAFAELYSCEIILVNIVEVPVLEHSYSIADGVGGGYGNAAFDADLFHSMMGSAQERMEKLTHRSEFEKYRITSLVEPGTIGTTITSTAEKYRVDLIIMGTHGTKGLSGIFIGSNAEEIVKTSKIPVITVKNKSVSLPKKIVFTTDFTEDSVIFYKKVKGQLEPLKATLFFLYVNTIENFEPSRELEKKARLFFEKIDVKNTLTVYNDLTVEDGILHFSEEVKADLIAAGHHGKGVLERFFKGSVTEDLVNHSMIPVLTFNPAES